MPFELFIFLLFIGGLVALAIGYYAGFSDGTDAGWDAGYDFATSEQETTWRLTASGESALAAADRPPGPQLTIHPQFLNANKTQP